MALIRYRVLQGSIENGAAYLPEKAIILGPWTEATTGLPVIAFMMTYADWVEEFPDDAKREAGLSVAEKDEETNVTGADNAK